MYKKLYSLVLFFVVVVLPFECWGQISASSSQAKKFQIMVGQSLTLTSTANIKRASVVAPEIADILVVSPRQVYLTGKAPGVTSLTFWAVDDKVFDVVNVEVSPDLSVLKNLVGEFVPDEKEIKISTVSNTVVVSGTARSVVNLNKILEMAEPYSHKGKVVNLAKVAGIQQVMLEVRVAEVSHSLLRRMGVNWSYFSSSGKVGFNLLGGLTGAGSLPGSVKDVGLTSAINSIFQFAKGGTTWTVFIDALKENGLVKVLASPTLIALNGKTAYFLAGGEIPIPVPQASSGGVGAIITIEYKPFGVGLNFTPTILDEKRINIHVTPEVSEPDFTNAIKMQGFLVPAFVTRRAATTIELEDGQSFVIAGLLRDDVKKDIQKYPLLGDIPVLGVLFRSTSWQRNESELIIVCTPKFVKPTDMTQQGLPTDKYSDPNDFDLYLNGKQEGGRPGERTPNY